MPALCVCVCVARAPRKYNILFTKIRHPATMSNLPKNYPPPSEAHRPLFTHLCTRHRSTIHRKPITAPIGHEMCSLLTSRLQFTFLPLGHCVRVQVCSNWALTSLRTQLPTAFCSQDRFVIFGSSGFFENSPELWLLNINSSSIADAREELRLHPV